MYVPVDFISDMLGVVIKDTKYAPTVGIILGLIRLEITLKRQKDILRRIGQLEQSLYIETYKPNRSWLDRLITYFRT